MLIGWFRNRIKMWDSYTYFGRIMCILILIPLIPLAIIDIIIEIIFLLFELCFIFCHKDYKTRLKKYLNRHKEIFKGEFY